VADWNAAQYLKFERERTRPAYDLLSQVAIDAPKLVVDLGCGPGNSTALLLTRWPAACVVGVDSSPDMLANARQRLPGAKFLEADVTHWPSQENDQEADLLFSNATLHWLPEHRELMPRLMRGVARGGLLAIQMPDNLRAPSHVALRETAADERWRERLAGVGEARFTVLTANDYYDLLAPLCDEVEIWHTTYEHVLPDIPAIAEWTKGTGARPFLDRLDATQQAQFLASYIERLHASYVPRADGKVLFAFERIFIVARRRSS
jgi:trans-aconitate 2-methyltransferase